MKSKLPFFLLLALMVLPACSSSPGDDDDSASDDDDAAGDDDDATGDDDDSAGDDDDATGDDDDATGDDDDASGDDDDSAGSECDDMLLADALGTLGSWPNVLSCGHSFSTSTESDTLRFAISFLPPEEQEMTVGMTWTQSFSGGPAADETPGVLEVQTGKRLTNWDCNDALEPGQDPVVDSRWDPLTGSATLSVTELTGAMFPGGPMTFVGEMTWTDVTVELRGSPGTSCALPDGAIPDLAFGWLAG